MQQRITGLGLATRLCGSRSGVGETHSREGAHLWLSIEHARPDVWLLGLGAPLTARQLFRAIRILAQKNSLNSGPLARGIF